MKPRMNGQMRKNLFYPVEVLKGRYIELTTKEMSVSRLAAGEKRWWLNPHPSMVLKPKTIILIDWTIAKNSPYVQYKKTELLKALLKGEYGESFSAWIYRDSKLLELTEKNVDNLLADSSLAQISRESGLIRVPDKETLLDLAKEKECSEESCVFLDHVLMERMLKNEEVEPFIAFEDLIKEGLIKDKITDEVTDEVTDSMSAMQTFYPHVGSIPVFARELSPDTVRLSNPQFLLSGTREEQGKVVSTIDSFCCGSDLFSRSSSVTSFYENASNFKKVDLRHSTAHMIPALAFVSEKRGCEELTLRGDITKSEDALKCDVSPLKNTRLKALSMFDLELEQTDLNTLLSNNPDLEFLIFHACTVGTAYPCTLPELPSLKKLEIQQKSLEKTYFSVQGTEAILKAAPHLTELSIARRSITDVFSRFSEAEGPGPLQELRKLSLTRVNIKAPYSPLSFCAATLEVLTLTDCDFNGDSFGVDASEQKMTALKHLTIKGSSGAGETLIAVLQRCPHLVSLTLEKFTLWGDFRVEDRVENLVCLPYLEKLIIQEVDHISVDFLRVMIGNSKNIKEIELEGSFLAEKSTIPPREESSYLRLEILSMKGNFQGFDFIKSMLCRASRLKSLSLDVQFDLSLRRVKTLLPELPHLEVLNLKSEKGCRSFLTQLLGAYVSVKELTITNLDKMELGELKPGSFSCVEHLTLKGDSSRSAGQLISLTHSSLRKFVWHSPDGNQMRAHETPLQAPIPQVENIEAISGPIDFPHLKYFEIIDGMLDTIIKQQYIRPMVNTAEQFECFKLWNTRVFSMGGSELIQVECKRADRNPSTSVFENIKFNIQRALQIAWGDKHLRLVSKALSNEEDPSAGDLDHSLLGGGAAKPAESTLGPLANHRLTSCMRNTTFRDRLNGDVNTALSDTSVDSKNRKIYSFNGSHPDAREYRQDFYNNLELNESPRDASDVFRLTPKPLEESDLESKEIPSFKGDFRQLGQLKQAGSSDRAFYYSKEHMTLSKKWTALLSLSSEDQLESVKVTPAVSYEIAYNKRDRCYMIRSSSEQAEGLGVDVEQLLSHRYVSNKPHPKTEQEAKHLEAIRQKIVELNAYGEGALELLGCTKGMDYLKAMMDQKKGACRHRSFILKYWMDQHYPQYATRVISNDVHAFVEIEIGGCALRCDLGGYPMNAQTLDSVNVDDFNQFTMPGRESDFDAPLLPSLSGNKQLSTKHQEVEPEEVESEEPISIERKKELLRDSYESFFQQEDSHLQSQEQFLRGLVSIPGKKHLLLSKNQEEHKAALLEVYKTAKENKQPVFWVRSPDDLTLHLGVRKDKDNKGVRTKELSGPLHEFLSSIKPEGPAPILLMDFSSFSKQDVIRSNSLADDTRKLGEVELPDNLTLIACQDLSKKDPYKGGDLRRRYTLHDDHGIKRASTEEVVRSPYDESQAPDLRINLFGNQIDWEGRLRARWKLNRDVMWYQNSPLIEALKESQKTGEAHPEIMIVNAPLSQPDYQLFWEQLKIDGEIDGFSIDVNRIHHKQEPEFDFHDVLESSEMPYSELEEKHFCLNPKTINALFVDCYVEKKEICFDEGLIKKAAKAGKKELPVVLTAPLRKSQWAELLDLAKTHGISLDIKRLPGVTPFQEEQYEQEEVEYQGNPFDISSNCSFVYSMNLDETVLALKQREVATIIQRAWRKHKEAHIEPQRRGSVVIDVTECDVTDLFSKISADAKSDAQKIIFEGQKKEVLRLLKQTNKTIILTGDFKNNLHQAMLPYMRKYPKRIICVTDNKEAFEAFDCQTHALPEKKVDLEPFMKLDSLNMLRVEKFDPSKSETKSNDFFKARGELIGNALENNPYVFISGFTGVGKSTFIEKHMPNALWGEEKLQQWAGNLEGGILFLDEANINQRQWSEFEGLFQNPPTMLINGKPKQLTPNHKVIFAGNPIAAGGERQLARLFERHGNAVVFQPLTANVVYEKILKPIFSGTLLESRLAELSAPLLDAYNLMVSLSDDKILVTPRQLKFIAMMTIAACHENKNLDPLEVLRVKARTVLIPLLGENHHSLNSISPKDPPAPEAPTQMAAKLGDDFYVTPSRQKSVDAIKDMLSVRHYQKNLRDSKKLNSDQARGGVCSLILEGMPGTGKTQLIQAVLKSKDFHEATYDKEGNLEPGQSDDTYLMIPATLSATEKSSRLIQAFNVGLLVVMDEANASPDMEELMNELKMGTHQGKASKNPGFVILGTQNPFSMGARQKGSTAKDKREHKIMLGEYPRLEMIDIAYHKHGIPRVHGDVLVDLFNEYRDKDPKKPMTFSCFLDILKKVSPCVKAIDGAIQRTEMVKRLVDANKRRRREEAREFVESQDDQSTVEPINQDHARLDKNSAEQHSSDKRRPRCDAELGLLATGAAFSYAGFCAAASIATIELISTFSAPISSVGPALSSNPWGALLAGAAVLLLTAAIVMTVYAKKRSSKGQSKKFTLSKSDPKESDDLSTSSDGQNKV